MRRAQEVPKAEYALEEAQLGLRTLGVVLIDSSAMAGKYVLAWIAHTESP